MVREERLLNMRSLKRIFLFALTSWSLSGCQLADMYLRGLIGPQVDKIPLFMDDFSDHENGWKVSVTNTGIVHYDQDTFRIMILEDNADYWSTPGINVKDSISDVDAVKVTGPGNNLFGLVCRWSDQNNYYAFQVSSDGYYGILRVQNGERKVISDNSLQTTNLIRYGEKINHLRADCVGNTLSLYVNWNKVAEVNDDTFTAGDVGLIASSLGEAGTDVRFDNFIVLAP